MIRLQRAEKDKLAWEGLVKGLKYDSTADRTVNKNMHPISYGKYGTIFLPITQNKESYWLYRTGLWDIGSMMLLGMALFVVGFFNVSL